MDSTTVKHIYEKSHFPSHSLGWESYFELENKFAFNKFNPRASRKTIKFSVTVGAKFPIKDIIDQIGHHVWMDRRIVMRWKGIQLLDTDATYALLGLDMKAFLEYVVQEAAEKVFEQCEREMNGEQEVEEKLVI